MAEESNGTFEVVDGQQRLTSICSFIDGCFPDGKEFRLSGLQVLEELNGKTFDSLDDKLQNEILSADLRLIVIKQESNPDVKFEVFERLNVGAEQLNDQELRNCVFRGPYNDMLREVAEHPTLQKLLGRRTPDNRMQDCQLLLRFFAMRRNTHLNYKAPMKQFLNREIRERQHASSEALGEMKDSLEKSLDIVNTVFGSNAFKRYHPGTQGNPNGHWEQNKINVALWDTVLYTFSFYEKRMIIPIADRIREEFLDLLTYDDRFVECITSTTDKPDKIRYPC